MIDEAHLVGRWGLVKHGRFDHLGHYHATPNPQRVNTTEIRLASFRGDDLVLALEPDEEGRYEIVWRKLIPT
jgi:hypothetical protein